MYLHTVTACTTSDLFLKTDRSPWTSMSLPLTHPIKHYDIRIFSKSLLLLRNLWDALMKFNRINPLTLKIRCWHSYFFSIFNFSLILSGKICFKYYVLKLEPLHLYSKIEKWFQNFNLTNKLHVKKGNTAENPSHLQAEHSSLLTQVVDSVSSDTKTGFCSRNSHYGTIWSLNSGFTALCLDLSKRITTQNILNY